MSDNFIGGNEDYVIESAIFSTDRGSDVSSYNIAKLITDLEIYEHLDKPYLTGKVLFVDTHATIENIDFQGGEKLTITIKPLTTTVQTFSITKTFYAQKIIASQRVNDQMHSVALYLVEDSAFVSSVYNINKSFTGTPSSIINTISGGYLGKEVLVSDEVYQNKMKVIVPNLHPIEAMNWIKERSTNQDGMPFYLYSVLADDRLRFYDLGTMLRRGPMNERNPYIYSETVSQTSMGENKTVVQQFEYTNVDDLLTLIRNGFVGAEYSFYDTMTSSTQKVKFNVTDDVFTPMINNEYFDKNQNKYNYGPGYKVDGTNISQYNSVNMSSIASADAFRNLGGYKTLNQERDSFGYKKRIIGQTLKNFMAKTPVTVQLSGIHFIDGSPGREHLTIGNTIRVLVPESVTDLGRSAEFDKKKSGDYIIYAARHMFSKERYDVKLVCTKLASYNKDPA